MNFGGVEERWAFLKEVGFVCRGWFREGIDCRLAKPL